MCHPGSVPPQTNSIYPISWSKHFFPNCGKCQFPQYLNCLRNRPANVCNILLYTPSKYTFFKLVVLIKFHVEYINRHTFKDTKVTIIDQQQGAVDWTLPYVMHGGINTVEISERLCN